VLLWINEKYIYGFQIVVGEVLLQLSSHILGVSWFSCGHWFRSTSSWVSRSGFCYVFSFLFIVVCFRFVMWRWRSVWLYIGYVIWFENIKYVFLHWRSEFLVLVLFYWMHISIPLDRFYLDVARKGKVRRCSMLMVVIVHHTLKILSVVVPSCVVGELW